MTKHSNRQPKIYAIKFEGAIIYIGKTTMSVDARYWEHLNRARCGKSTVPKLYEHMRANDFSGYTFEMLEATQPEHADAREIFWITKCGTRGKQGCNVTPGGSSVRGEDHYMWGKTAHPKAIEASIAFRKGKPMPQAWRNAISKANKGKQRPDGFPVVCTTTGEEFHSILAASKRYGVSMFTMQQIVYGKSDKTKRRKLKDLDFKLKDRHADCSNME